MERLPSSAAWRAVLLAVSCIVFGCIAGSCQRAAAQPPTFAGGDGLLPAPRATQPPPAGGQWPASPPYTAPLGATLSVTAASPAAVSPDAELALLSPEERVNIAVYENCYRSVVHIATQALQVDRLFMTATPEEGSGSGSILDVQGHVLTNYHVIEGAERIVVTLHDGQQFDAQLIGQDPPNDMAVLRIDAPPELLQPVTLGDSEHLRVGQKVYAIGSPFGLERTMTVGIVSSLNRTVPSHNHRTLKSMIQVDAALNQGNSGGPLLDSRGRQVGMNTAIASSTGANTGVGFAIPSATIRRVAPQLVTHGRVSRPTLGIEAYVQTPRGLMIGSTTSGGPAERAGLRGVRIIRRRSPFGERRSVDIGYADTILSIDGLPVRTLDDLMTHIETRRAGQTVSMTVEREGAPLTVQVVLGGDEQ